MKFGFIPTEGGQYYREFFSEAMLGEKLGFDSVWLEEHHGVKDHYWPSPMVGLAGLAACTDHILIGTDIVVLPFYNPIRVAEDAAMLDGITKGRFILGAAIGYRPDEFSLFQLKMQNRGKWFEEAVQLIRALWTEDSLHFNGEYFQIDGLGIEPHPFTSSGPPIWLGGWGPRALSRAARYGDAWIPGPTASLSKLLEAQACYRDYLTLLDHQPESRPNPLTREVVIAKTDQEAAWIAEHHLLINYRDEYGGGKWQHPLIGNEDPAQVHRLDEIGRDRFIFGSPETVIRQIQTYKQAFGVDHLICRLYFPGISHAFIENELRLLAGEVIPAFRSL